MAHLRPCLECGKPSPGPYCDDHQPAYGYETREWRTVTRPAVLERADHRCELALDGCTGRATTVHRRPEHGTAHDANLDAYDAACRHCHGVVDGGRASTAGAGRDPDDRL